MNVANRVLEDEEGMGVGLGNLISAFFFCPEKFVTFSLVFFFKLLANYINHDNTNPSSPPFHLRCRHLARIAVYLSL
jgi:hypothetical protein